MANQREGTKPSTQQKPAGAKAQQPMADLDSDAAAAEKVKGGLRRQRDEDPCAGGE